MLYFAYGSNLFHKQMKKRCKDSIYIKCFILKNYKLYFRNNYLGGGVADIQKRKKHKVLGALYKISKKDEKKLDVYENFPKTYVKKYFRISGKKVMFYYMPKKTKYNPPSKRYLNLILQGYKDCGWNKKILLKTTKTLKRRLV
tara:strand:+ start:324 stop:752 length:429 start_codon:yes stop_codon:yes gene_type:complete